LKPLSIAYKIAFSICSSSCCSVSFKVFIKIGEIGIKITISFRSASIQASISSFLGREIPTIDAFLQFSFTIVFTMVFSDSETAGYPTAIIFTPISSIIFARWIFSSRVKYTVGLCSPSRKVSSHKQTSFGISRF